MVAKKILLVEDESIEALDIKRTLESFGYDVPYIASSGEEAIEKTLEIMPDFILMDIILKGDTDGIETVSKIKDLNIPVIYLTAHSEESTIERAKLTEPYGYIIKPYDNTELKYAIELAIYKNQMEKELKESERKYKTLFEGAGVGIGYYDVDGKIISYNNLAATQMNSSPEELEGKTLNELFGDETASEYMNRLENTLKTGETNIYEDLVNLPKEIKWFQSTYNRVEDAEGNIIGVQVISQDITEQKLSEGLLRGLFDNMPSGMAVYQVKNDGSKGSDYIIKEFNQASQKIEGMKREEVLGKSLYDIRPNIDEYGLIPIFRKVWETGEPIRYPAKIYLDAKYANWYENYVFKSPTGEIVAIYNDITERKKAEKNLLESEKKFKTVADYTYDCEYWVGPEGDLLYLSPSCERITGYHPDEFMKDPTLLMKIIHPEDIEIREHLQNESTSQQSHEDIEYRIITKQGEEKWITHGCQPVYNHKGEFLGRRASNRDITKRKEAENILKESQEFLENIVENIPNMIFVKSADKLHFEMVNKAAEELLGHSREELLGKSDFDFFPKTEADFFTKKDREVLQNKNLTDVPEETIETKNLGQRILHTKKIPLLNQKGEPKYLLGISEDITELKKAETSLAETYHSLKLRTAELTNTNVVLKAEIKERKIMEKIIKDNVRRLNLALEAAHMGAWDLNLMNDTSIRTLEHDQIFGYDSLLPEWGSKILFEHIIPEDLENVQKRFKKAYETNKLYFQCRINRADKKVRWIEVYGNIYRDEKDVPIRMLGVVVDITERKKAENQLLKVIGEKETLLREIHHRVKNNMQIISSLLRLESSKVFDKRDADLFTTVQDRIKSMSLIHGNLYQSEDLSSIKFNEYIEGLNYQLFTTHATSSNIKLITDITDISLNMETAIPLGLIVNELVTNSLKYAFPESEGEIFISLHFKGEAIELIIKDNGVGIPKDVDIKKPKGLGLELVNSLVEQLEGTIELNRNHGTKFKITFKELKYQARI